MKVIHVSVSPIGGAGMVAKELSESQKLVGIDTTFKYQLESNLQSQPFRLPVHTIAAAIDEYVIKKQGVPLIITPMRSKLSSKDIFNELSESEADIIHLHWVNGVLTTSQLGQLVASGKQIVWTLHDMAPFTGACHHAFECVKFANSCSECPEVNTFFQRLPEHALNQKKQSHDLFGKVNFVAPSRWMKAKALESPLIRKDKLTLIHNPVRVDETSASHISHSWDWARKLNNIGVLVANNLSEPNKGIEEVVKRIKEKNATQSTVTNIILVGSKGSQFHAPASGIYWVGRLTRRELFQLYSFADFFINSSTAESFSLTTAEAISAGLFVYVKRGSAAVELTENFANSFVYDSSESLISQLMAELHITEKRNRQIGFLDKYEPSLIATKYIQLYGKILSENNN